MEFISRLKSLRSLLLLSSFRLLSLASIFCCVTPITSGLSDDLYPLRAATEVTPRKGLPNFKSKLDAGKKVKIAYLGGSITAAPGWRVLSLDWFQNEYPKAKLAEIHAAIGGTGSDLGVFRIQNDVLRHKPDLLFVEFAVNDGGALPAQIHKAMEGIVRQTWKADPSIDLCFVYTLSEPVLENLRNGKMQRSASAMEDVADHYSIPSIHFGVKVMAMESAGELIFKAPKTSDLATSKPMVFSTDGVHPHAETGHKVYTETIARSWPAIRDASGDPMVHSLPKPIRDDNWELARQIPITQEMLRGQWEPLPKDHTLAKRFQKNMPVIFVAQKPGATLEYTFEGTSIAVFDILGPDGGQISVQLDEAAPVTVNRVDGYGTYHRMSKLNVGSDLPNKTHRVRIELNATSLPKREILFERNRDDFDKVPSKYSDHLWYASSLLIIGK
ncbi:MAG: GDSL-type esterase/lipase family protein [Planctomycetota bacterium]|nr:GDSL-type esterase/lipase family protein [Planctomycetota bacterium]